MTYGGDRRRREPAWAQTDQLPHGTEPRPQGNRPRSQSGTHGAEPRRRHARRQPVRKRRSGLLVAGRSLVALVAALVLIGTGAAWRTYNHAVGGVTTSNAIVDGPKSSGKDQNILIMGLDSRLDEHGNALPQEMYDALHAGDDSTIGMNSNVLMLIHIPGDGSKSTAISIPRDDYVALDTVACGGSTCKGKIKEAYGDAYGLTRDKLTKSVKDPQELDRQSRDAGRRAESNTVSKFLGGVPIDHFVEVTLAAFFEVAQSVQPITVCLNEKTSDNFSGANFVKGTQDINASQAMAFVRQRRDPDESLNFTDLDRTRRQQAFIVSLASKLQSSGTISSPNKLMGLLNVAQQNMAVDSGLDLGKFAQQASKLMSGGLSLFTLPVKDFSQDPNSGEDINLVDVDDIRSIVHNLLNPPKANAPTTTPAPMVTLPIPDASGVAVNVVNSTGRNGLGAHLEQALTARGFTQGDASTGSPRSTSTLMYGSGAESAATALAEQLGLTATKSSALDAQSVQLTVGADAGSGPIADLTAGMPDDSSSSTSATTTPPAPVSATAQGATAPAPTDLSSMDGNGVPCVK